ncbi:hypothetical protein SLA2020_376300 [Shorea laevis]
MHYSLPSSRLPIDHKHHSSSGHPRHPQTPSVQVSSSSVMAAVINVRALLVWNPTDSFEPGDTPAPSA